jgi:SAM-dependent methyltransferase
MDTHTNHVPACPVSDEYEDERMIKDSSHDIRPGWTMLNRCPICSSAKIAPLYNARDPHYGNKGTFTTSRCGSCSVVFLNPVPADELLAGLYPNTYYAYQSFADKTAFLRRLFRILLMIQKGTKEPRFEKPGRMLDLGCGSGEFVAQAQRRGWDAYGVDISEAAAEIGRKAGLSIIGGTLESAHFPDQHFNYVRSNHSFEHIPHPHETLDEIYRILKPGGTLLIGVPNIDSWTARKFREHWWFLCSPVHPFLYSPSTLSSLLEKHSFKVERVNFNSDYAGILGSMHICRHSNEPDWCMKSKFTRNYVAIVVAQRIAKILDFQKKGDMMEITARKVQHV